MQKVFRTLLVSFRKYSYVGAIPRASHEYVKWILILINTFMGYNNILMIFLND